MSTTADRRLQLEEHLENFRTIAEKRNATRERKWVIYVPALICLFIIKCQSVNTLYFYNYAYSVGQLYYRLEDFFANTLALNQSWNVSEDNNINKTKERISEIDVYHESLWRLFVSEALGLIFPLICIVLFGFEMARNRQGKQMGWKLLIIYLLCPMLTLVLSAAQACMIYITLSPPIFPVRYVINRAVLTLLNVHPDGRHDLENYFKCEFYDTVDELPPCSGVFHDQVMPASGINFLLALHIIPLLVAIYLIVHQLKTNPIEHLFLYIETTDHLQNKKTPGIKNQKESKQPSEYLQKTLKPFSVSYT